MTIEMRKQYANTILELFAKDDNVYALEADLSGAMATSGLKDVLKVTILIVELWKQVWLVLLQE